MRVVTRTAFYKDDSEERIMVRFIRLSPSKRLSPAPSIAPKLPLATQLIQLLIMQQLQPHVKA